MRFWRHVLNATNDNIFHEYTPKCDFGVLLQVCILIKPEGFMRRPDIGSCNGTSCTFMSAGDKAKMGDISNMDHS